jgi:hypothetical protein
MDQMTIDMMRQLDKLQVAFDGLVKPEIPLAASIRPLFSAYVSSTISNVTGDGTAYTIIFDTEITDRDGNYNNANGIFTAPVDGNYLFISFARANDLGTMNQDRFYFDTSNRDYYVKWMDATNVLTAGDYTYNGSCIADMDEGDTCGVVIDIAGGAKVVDIQGGTVWSFFMGFLLP